MPSNANQRKKYFVDRSVQGSILLHIVAHWAMFLVVAGVFLFFIELLVGDPRDAGKNLLARHGPTLLAVLVLAPILIRDLCRLTNRFAGPMVRLRRAMHDLAEGREVSPIHFRDRDFWEDLAIDFNRVAERVQSTKAVKENDMQELAMTSGVPEDA
jgi:signal transduction histidine kinase